MNKINKKQVAEILGVHTKSLSRWDDEKIKYELSKNCYKVLDIVKEGRNIYFYSEYMEYSQSNDEHLEEVFKVRNVESLKRYTKRKVESIEKEEMLTRNELCKKVNISNTTSKRYDEKLIEKGIFQKTGEVIHICVDNKTKRRVIVDKEAYNNFWSKNSAISRELKALAKKYRNNVISINEYNYLRDILIEKSEVSCMYYKVSNLIIKYDNYLYKMLIEEEKNPLLFLLGNIGGLSI